MQFSALTNFYKVIRDDNRITTTHISLYMALFELWNQNEFQNPVYIRRGTVMETAKISGLATFHKCIKDLHAFGYIRYLPSMNPAVSSRVFLVSLA